MAEYSVRIKRSAAQEIERIEPINLRRLVVERIESLAFDPRPPGCEKISSNPDRYRVRQGSYRIVYQIDDEALIVLVVKVGHRREVYRNL